MKYFDTKFNKKEPKLKRNYEIDDNLYVKLEEFSTVYDASVADLIDACIENYMSANRLFLYEKPQGALLVTHTIRMRESNVLTLERMKEKTGVSIFRLVNSAIQFTLEE